MSREPMLFESPGHDNLRSTGYTRALTLATDRFSTLDICRREAEERIENAALRGQLELRSSRANAEQVLQYYVFHSNEKDVNYFFDRYPRDWRVVELVPMALGQDLMGDVVLDMFVALHRLRSNNAMHLLHYSRALCNFMDVLQQNTPGTRDWLKMLSCILLLAQYEVNTRRGKDLSTHLRAIANLFNMYGDTPVPAALEYQKRTLTRIAMTYDIQHNLVTGEGLHLGIEHYRNMRIASGPTEITETTRLSLDQLWSETHLCWAEFAVATSSSEIDETAIESLCIRLARNIQYCQSHYYTVDADSALHSYCPFGDPVIYKSPALRLVGIFNHTLALMLCSWWPRANTWFHATQSRNHIMCAHAPLFVHDRRGRRSRNHDGFVSQVFPAILHITIAASEVHPDEIECQEWIVGIMKSTKEIGYSLGLGLIIILQSHPPEDGRGLWRAIGCKTYVLTCRHLRQQGLA